MKPIDYRNATYADLSDQLKGMRHTVLEAWRTHGPATTERLAELSGLSILTLRPRTTELFQLGFVVLDESSPKPTGGGAVYRAATPQEVRQHFHHQKSAVSGEAQLNLL